MKMFTHVVEIKRKVQSKPGVLTKVIRTKGETLTPLRYIDELNNLSLQLKKATNNKVHILALGQHLSKTLRVNDLVFLLTVHASRL